MPSAIPPVSNATRRTIRRRATNTTLRKRNKTRNSPPGPRRRGNPIENGSRIGCASRGIEFGESLRNGNRGERCSWKRATTCSGRREWAKRIPVGPVAVLFSKGAVTRCRSERYGENVAQNQGPEGKSRSRSSVRNRSLHFRRVLPVFSRLEVRREDRRTTFRALPRPPLTVC